MTKAIPEGFHSITPTIAVENADEAIALYKKAFGATVDTRMDMPDSKKVMHACLSLGDSKLFVSDVFPGCPASTNSQLYLYVEDCDKVLKQAIAAGCEQKMAAEDMFWGDRLGSVKDKFGISWSIATHVKDVSESDLQKGRDAFIAKMKQQPKAA